MVEVVDEVGGCEVEEGGCGARAVELVVVVEEVGAVPRRTICPLRHKVSMLAMRAFHSTLR